MRPQQIRRWHPSDRPPLNAAGVRRTARPTALRIVDGRADARPSVYPSPAPITPADRRPCTVLLVNDDALAIAAIHAALASVDHHLIVGPTLEAAVHALQQRSCAPFDVVLVDLELGCEALWLMHHLQSCCPALPIVALVPTAPWARRNCLNRRAFLVGAAALVEKPVRATEVADALRHFCRCRGATSSRPEWLNHGRSGP